MYHRTLVKKLEELKKQAIIDELTGVYNYRHFKDTLEREVYRAKRYFRKLSLMIVDIDNFKRLNDTKGHSYGDCVIVDVVNIIKNNTRKSNIICRYGGDEFIIILPETDKKQTYALAKRIRKIVHKHEKTTVSIGLASFPQDGKTVKGLFNSADRALFKAKEKKDTVNYGKEI